MWMKKACRDLTNYQWRLVSNAIEKCSLPIFVKLVFAEVCRWRSYTKPQDTHLASTVMDSIMMLFERIEKQVKSQKLNKQFVFTARFLARKNFSFSRVSLYNRG